MVGEPTERADRERARIVEPLATNGDARPNLEVVHGHTLIVEGTDRVPRGTDQQVAASAGLVHGDTHTQARREGERLITADVQPLIGLRITLPEAHGHETDLPVRMLLGLQGRDGRGVGLDGRGVGADGLSVGRVMLLHALQDGTTLLSLIGFPLEEERPQHGGVGADGRGVGRDDLSVGSHTTLDPDQTLFGGDLVGLEAFLCEIDPAQAVEHALDRFGLGLGEAVTVARASTDQIGLEALLLGGNHPRPTGEVDIADHAVVRQIARSRVGTDGASALLAVPHGLGSVLHGQALVGAREGLNLGVGVRPGGIPIGTVLIDPIHGDVQGTGVDAGVVVVAVQHSAGRVDIILAIEVLVHGREGRRTDDARNGEKNRSAIHGISP